MAAQSHHESPVRKWTQQFESWLSQEESSHLHRIYSHLNILVTRKVAQHPTSAELDTVGVKRGFTKLLLSCLKFRWRRKIILFYFPRGRLKQKSLDRMDEELMWSLWFCCCQFWVNILYKMESVSWDVRSFCFTTVAAFVDCETCETWQWSRQCRDCDSEELAGRRIDDAQDAWRLLELQGKN